MLVFPFRGWWAPGRPVWSWWLAAAGRQVPERVPVLVLGRARPEGTRGGPRSWWVVFPASLAFIGGVPAGGGVVVVSSSVRARAAGQAGSFGRAAWSLSWSSLGPVPWSVVAQSVPLRVRARWSSSVPGSAALPVVS